MTEPGARNKPRRAARPLADVAAGLLADSYRKQGFASSELVLRWDAIVGADVAAHAEPIKIQWPRALDGDVPQPGTLILRVEGPAAIEIQHLSGIILERVNRYFGFAAIGKIAIRQAPLRKRQEEAVRRLDLQQVQRLADTLPHSDAALREALARLGTALKAK